MIMIELSSLISTWPAAECGYPRRADWLKIVFCHSMGYLTGLVILDENLSNLVKKIIMLI